MRCVRPLVTCVGLVGLWWLLQAALHVPPYLLPAPPRVVAALWSGRAVLAECGWTTLQETGLGLVLGGAAGGAAALLMALSPLLRRWLLPVLLLSQAVPVFALAPL